MNNSLSRLVGALPEIYQPIFSHPEFSGVVARDCKDRLAHIIQIYQAFQAQLNRPLRVLDLGCAQGFFSFNLARLGAIVDGVDYLDANIEVCRALATEYPEFKVSFRVGRIEDILPLVEPGQYDLVLGLSVFHHVVYERGASVAGQMLTELASKITAGIFELALNSEPLYWGASQLQKPRLLLEGFVFVHEVAEHRTHLSDINRPLYIASNRYWFLNGRIGEFDLWQIDSHRFARGAHRGSRRCFFGGGLCIKLFYLDQPERFEVNLQEHDNAVAFLSNPPPGFNAPRLLLKGKNKHETWLVREQLPGELLVDIICDHKAYDAPRVLQDVLAQLVALESAGLYHNDLRVWNVLISPNGRADLIDYGAISKDKKDCVWSSGGIFLAFFIFVYEVTSGEIKFSNPAHTKGVRQYRLKQPYQNWLYAFWSTPMDQWNFNLLQQLFTQRGELQKNNQITEKSSQVDWVESLEKAVNTQMSFNSHLQEQQLKTAYANRSSWVVWPFQKTMLAFKLLICWFNRMAKFLLVWLMRKVLANHYLKTKISKVLSRFPRLKQYLRATAIRSGLTVNKGINITKS